MTTALLIFVVVFIISTVVAVSQGDDISDAIGQSATIAAFFAIGGLIGL